MAQAQLPPDTYRKGREGNKNVSINTESLGYSGQNKSVVNVPSVSYSTLDTGWSTEFDLGGLDKE